MQMYMRGKSQNDKHGNRRETEREASQRAVGEEASTPFCLSSHFEEGAGQAVQLHRAAEMSTKIFLCAASAGTCILRVPFPPQRHAGGYLDVVSQPGAHSKPNSHFKDAQPGHGTLSASLPPLLARVSPNRLLRTRPEVVACSTPAMIGR